MSNMTRQLGFSIPADGLIPHIARRGVTAPSRGGRQSADRVSERRISGGGTTVAPGRPFAILPGFVRAIQETPSGALGVVPPPEICFAFGSQIVDRPTRRRLRAPGTEA
jgi:hypothetical protein